jgi:hypothetical protein
MSKIEIECDGTADCKEKKRQALQKNCGQGDYTLADSGWSGGVATITCLPITPQVTASAPSSDDHMPALSVRQTPATLTRTSHWLLSSNCSRAPIIRQLASTSFDGRLLYEVFCLSGDQTLSGNRIVSTATGSENFWPAKHNRLGCFMVETHGQAADFWQADDQGFMDARGSKLAFNTEIEITTCPSAKKAMRIKLYVARKRGSAKHAPARPARKRP